MCQLDSLKVGKKTLPLEPPYDQMWLTIQKVIIQHVCMYVAVATIHNALKHYLL